MSKFSDNFVKNQIPNTDTLGSLIVVFVGQMFVYKGHEPIVTFNQISADIIAVVVAVHIFHAENSISAVMGQNITDNFVFSKQQDRSQGVAFLISLVILLV